MTAAVRAPVMKEVRALLPAWAACTTAVAAGVVLRDPRVLMIGVLAYGLGSIALGAQSVGHEYTHRTLGLLLSQPSDRQRLALIKCGVLASMLLVLAAVAAAVLFDYVSFERSPTRHNPELLALPILCGLFVAPWLTMACRSPLAGVVFTVSLTGLLLLFSQLAGTLKYGLDHPDAKSFGSTMWMRGMIVLAAVGAVLTWRSFMRLEAIDGSGQALALPSWLRGTGRFRGRHPVWLLVTKEVHLQQPTFVVVVLYAIAWAVGSLLKNIVPGLAEFPLVPITMLYLVMLSILIGSLASAEERQLGVVEWQTLLPMAAWRQWLVKVGVVLSLALLLGVGLPAVLNYITPAPDHFGDWRAWRQNIVWVIALTVFSLYVSSLCTSGIRAMMVSFPAGIAGAAMVQWALSSLFVDAAVTILQVHRSVVGTFEFREPVLFVVVTAFFGLVLWFAFVNHRSAERGTHRVAQQVLLMAAYLPASALLYAGMVAVFLAFDT